jgi:hypothetical protein
MDITRWITPQSAYLAVSTRASRDQHPSMVSDDIFGNPPVVDTIVGMVPDIYGIICPDTNPSARRNAVGVMVVMVVIVRIPDTPGCSDPAGCSDLAGFEPIQGRSGPDKRDDRYGAFHC